MNLFLEEKKALFFMHLFYKMSVYFLYSPKSWISKLKFYQKYEKPTITIWWRFIYLNWSFFLLLILITLERNQIILNFFIPVVSGAASHLWANTHHLHSAGSLNSQFPDLFLCVHVPAVLSFFCLWSSNQLNTMSLNLIWKQEKQYPTEHTKEK